MSRIQTNTKPSAAPAAAAPTSTRSEVREVKPTTDQIQKRAYQLYLERTASGRAGSALSDWEQAERELTAKR